MEVGEIAGLIAAIAVIALGVYMLVRPYKEAQTLTKTVRVTK